MRVAFVTVGDTGRRTGGYLYNARVITGLRALGFELEEIVAGGAAVVDQESSSPALGARLSPSAFDVIVVDALARVAVAPHLDRWREVTPVVAMVHELPSVAGESTGNVACEREYEEPLLRSDRLVAVSDHGRRLLESRGVPAGRIQIVPPGFDRLDQPATGSAPGREVRVLCVAQWIPRKGISTLVDAWTRRRCPGAVLQLVGETDAEPDYAARVRDAIASAHDTSIVVSGAVDDVALSEAYAAADLFVLPSVYEGYGMVYAEALSFGLPVIACEVGPVPDLTGREAALLVPPDDPETLSEALDLLLEDPALRRRMTLAARRRARDLPRWEETVAGFDSALRGAVRDGTRRIGSIYNLLVERRDIREQNRHSWNAVVGAHDSHRGDLVGFLRESGNTLFPEERELLGDLGGKTLAHLQCNTGGDAISLAKLGATVTGVDISDEAIRSARQLSEKTGISVSFDRADIYDWLVAAEREERRFDVVYCSYGVVCWLPDLTSWATGITALLNPGGHFVLVDFHPAASMFDEDWNHAHDYPRDGEPLPLDEGVGDYVAASEGGLTPAGFEDGVQNFENSEPCHLFQWGLGEVVTALAAAGLRITALEEYPYSNGERHFGRMRELPGRRMVPPADISTVPLMYGIRAERPG